MPDKVTVTVDLHGIDEKLYGLGPKIAKRLLRKAFKAVGIIAVEEIKSRVPVDSGDLRDSINYTIKTSTKSDSASMQIGPTYDSKAIKSGQGTSSSPGVYGMFVEFGLKTKKYTKTPFMRPTFDGSAERWVEVFAENLKEDLEEAING